MLPAPVPKTHLLACIQPCSSLSCCCCPSSSKAIQSPCAHACMHANPSMLVISNQISHGDGSACWKTLVRTCSRVIQQASCVDVLTIIDDITLHSWQIFGTFLSHGRNVKVHRFDNTLRGNKQNYIDFT